MTWFRTNTTVFLLLITTLSFGQITKENHLIIGKIELGDKNYNSAIKHLTLATNQIPNSYEPFYYRAMAKVELGDFIGGELDIDKAIEIDPRNENLFILAANIKERLNKYKDAFNQLDLALKLNSRNPDIFLNRAIINLNTNQPLKAKEDCEKALLLNSKKELVYIIKGISNNNLKKYKEAISDFNLIIENNPFNAINYVRRASAFYHLEKLDLAMNDLESAFKLEPDNSYAYFQRALIYKKEERVTKAIEDLNRVIELEPNTTSAYYNRANLHADSKNYKAAIEDYTTVLSLSNKNVLTYFNRAITYQKLKQNKAALEDIEKAISIYPDFVDAYKVRASIKQELGDYYGAKSDNETAEIINKSKISLTDSLKVEEERFIAQLTSFSNGKSNGTALKKIDIAITQPLVLSTFSDKTEKHIIDIWNNTNNSYSSYHLLAIDDKVNTAILKEQLNALNGSIAEKRNTDNLVKRGIIYTLLEKPDLALLDLNEAISLGNTNHLAYFCRGNLMYSTLRKLENESINSSLQTVIKDFTKCVELNPKFAYAYFNRAYIKFQENNYVGAIDDYTKAIKASESFTDAYFNRALLLLILDNKSKACEDMSKAGELGKSLAYKIIGKYCSN